MKIIKAYPPNFSEIAKVFPVKGKQGILYAWGDRIYNPSGIAIPSYLVAHEEVHGKRQLEVPFSWSNLVDKDAKVNAWWQAYIDHPEFRLQEEIPAHRAEFRAYRDARTSGVPNYLAMMASRLSGPLYGYLIGFDHALEIIRNDDPS